MSSINSTRRPIEAVAGFHGLSLRDFEGATIYDLGCGYSNLERDLALYGITASVTGFDTNPELFDDARNPTTKPHRIYAPLTELPVEDNSADVVLATYSLPMFGPSTAKIGKFYAECERVVKPRGLLAVYPLIAAASLSAQGIENPEAQQERALALVGGAEAIRHSPKWRPLASNSKALTARKIA